MTHFMPYEIDQSNKIEFGRKPTALALTNDHDYTVLIPVKERGLAFGALADHDDRKSAMLMLFSAALYFVVRELPLGATVTIDTEYTGWERYIRNILLQWLHQERPDIVAEHLVFQPVGKSSRAHKNALAAHRGDMSADRILRADDLVTQIIGSKKAK